jgi:hypothetical protein
MRTDSGPASSVIDIDYSCIGEWIDGALGGRTCAIAIAACQTECNRPAAFDHEESLG